MDLPPLISQKAGVTPKPSSHRGCHLLFAFWHGRLSSQYLDLYVWKSVHLEISVFRRQCQLRNESCAACEECDASDIAKR